MSEPRFPKLQAKGVCRGCLGPVPKGRFTWCSQACKQKFDPFWVKKAVYERDKGLCRVCGRKAYTKREMRRDWKWGDDFWPVILKNMKLHRAEYDHIVPHCEGGKFVLENIRLLGRSCHLERTRKWRAERKNRK